MDLARCLLKKELLRLNKIISAHPGLRALIGRVLSRFPRLQGRLRNLENSQEVATRGIEGPGDLSQRARQIYFDLKSALAQHQKEQS